MKRFLLMLSFAILFVFTGCQSESGEISDYHNDFIGTINPILDEVNAHVDYFWDIDDPEEALDYYNENMLPHNKKLIESLKSLEPSSEVAQELHELRKAHLDTWVEAYTIVTEALEKAIAMEDDDIIGELLDQADQKLEEAEEKFLLADERFEEIIEEYDIELIEIKE